jgi:hypothetical protein
MVLIKELNKQCSQITSVDDVTDEFGQLLTDTLKVYLIIKIAKESDAFNESDINNSEVTNGESIF